MAYTNIDDPSKYFQVALHTSANSVTVTNDGNSDLQPDLIWSKARAATHNHGVYDSTRGVTKLLSSNTNSIEATASSGYDLTSFNTDGFSTGNNQFNSICGGTSYVAWQWKANGGTTSTNTAGDIDSTVQVNTDAGFSIVTWSAANTTQRTIGHGLGVTPEVVIIKNRNRSGGENWRVFHAHAGTNPGTVITGGGFTLDDTVVYNTNTNLFNGMSTSTFTVGTDLSVNGAFSYVAYCFASKQGFSKMSQYIGNGTAGDGPMIHTGFRPAFIMIKPSNAAIDWFMFDHKRAGANTADARYNEIKSVLYANATSAGSGTSYRGIDFLSNGFKLRNGGNGGPNQDNITYTYMAFAEHPFVTSTGIPTTAR